MDTETLKARLGEGRTGTYILCLALQTPLQITIGKLGRFTFRKGFYYYVGSAFGPGGIAARCKHHIQYRGKPRWHIDYLRKYCQLTGIVFSTDKRHLEHAWAERLHRGPHYSVAIDGFGASDCRCDSHLFYTIERLDPSDQINMNAEVFPVHGR